MYRQITLIPAYGRDYKKAQDAIRDWEEGKDWRIAPDGPYVSALESRNFLLEKFTHVCLRYRQHMRMVIVPLSNENPNGNLTTQSDRSSSI